MFSGDFVAEKLNWHFVSGASLFSLFLFQRKIRKKAPVGNPAVEMNSRNIMENPLIKLFSHFSAYRLIFCRNCATFLTRCYFEKYLNLQRGRIND